jgi:hypothetical protein
MSQGIVTASSLNLRATPGGTIVASLPKGTTVEILENQGEWLQVSAQNRTGFVASQYVEGEDGQATTSPTVPPAAQPGDITVANGHAVGPGGVVFARSYQQGFVNTGDTTIGAFLATGPSGLDGLSASRQRVLEAVSANEGNLEALNSWDNCFLSFGVFQWTAGADTGTGELAALIDLIKTTEPAAFQSYFAAEGLDVTGLTSGTGVQYGYLTLNDQTLNTSDAKAVLRQPIWAYRFWRAGHDSAVRACQIRHAAGRIDCFYGPGRCTIQNRPLSAYVTSEYGVALLLDEHVNRPGHVPGTLAQAYQDFTAGGGKPDPSGWGDAEEQSLLAHYLTRRAATSMTESDTRAAHVTAAVQSGQLSNKRGSFV